MLGWRTFEVWRRWGSGGGVWFIFHLGAVLGLVGVPELPLFPLFLHCECSNVSSICLTILHCVFSNVIYNSSGGSRRLHGHCWAAIVSSQPSLSLYTLRKSVVVTILEVFWWRWSLWLRLRRWKRGWKMNIQFPIDFWAEIYVGDLQNEICQIKELLNAGHFETTNTKAQIQNCCKFVKNLNTNKFYIHHPHTSRSMCES